MKTVKTITLSISLLIFASVCAIQAQSFKPSVYSINGISSQNFPGKASSRFFNYFPFFTNQVSFMLIKQPENPLSLKFGLNAIVNRYIYETVLFEHTIAFRSDYFLTLPVLLEKKFEVKKSMAGSQIEKYWSIYGGLSVDWYIAQHDNLFYYKFEGYKTDDNGDWVYVEEFLRGRDAKKYNTTNIQRGVIPLSLACHLGISKHYSLENNAILETGFNFQFMEVVSLYNENLFFPGNGLKLNFNFSVAYVFGKQID